MKRVFSMLWQMLLLPILYYPYKFLRENVIVDFILGHGEHFAGEYKANNITWIFWVFIVMVVIVISLFSMRKLTTWYYRLLYIAGITFASGYIALFFISSMIFITPPV